MLRIPIYPYMPCLVCLVFWSTTRARPPVRHLVALSGRSLRRTLRVQVVAEGLAQPLVTWSTLARGVFPAWSPAWFMISRKEDREHRGRSLRAGRYSGCWVIGGCGCLEGPCSPRGRGGSFMLRSPIYPYMPCLVCLVFWPTTHARPLFVTCAPRSAAASDPSGARGPRHVEAP